MVLETTLKSVIETATGKICHANEKPLEAVTPCTVYRIIVERQKMLHSGDTKYRKARVQLTLIATSPSALATLRENIRTALNANKTDWEVSLPLETRIDDKEDGLYYTVLEYYISYQA